jgi:hypothetical protein
MLYKKFSLTLFAAFLFTAALSQAQEDVLGRFEGTNSALPGGSLIADAAGNLYGVAPVGVGQNQNGSIYELVAPTAPGGTWKQVELYRFPRTGFSNPGSPLLFDAAGNLYGTSLGGSGKSGTVFELSPPAAGGTTWTFSVLYNFLGGTSDGAIPNSGLILDAAGNLYSVTAYGGVCDAGVAYKLSPPGSGGGTWTETLLHVFTGNCKGHNQDDGAGPTNNLLLSRNGTLYGVTNGGGSLEAGTAFALVPPAAGRTAWTEHILYSFPGGTEGGYPEGSLISDGKGNLYGTTYEGGNQACYNGIPGCGTVFEMIPPAAGGAWTVNTIYSFTGGNDGADPFAGVIFDGHGNLYGTTQYGANTGVACPDSDSSVGCGTVFQLKPPAPGGSVWTENTLYAFTGSTDGAYPTGGVLLSKGGNELYGSTSWGGDLSCTWAGSIGCGLIFQIRP